MIETTDFMRADITQQRNFDRMENFRHPNPESSLAATEFSSITYRNSRWDFAKDVEFKGNDLVDIESGYAFPLKVNSSYSELLGADTLVTGSLDFSFGELPTVIQQQNSEAAENLAEAWVDCASRKFSYINFSLMPTINGKRLPKSPWLPVFLFDLNRYYKGDSQNLFSQFTNRESEMFKKYLDNAFEESAFSYRTSRIASYCSEILFLEDPLLLEAMIDCGHQFQVAQDTGKPLLANMDEVRKLIYLARWYWAEKQTNIPFYK